MHTNLTLFFAFFALFVHLHCSFGLRCKVGRAERLADFESSANNQTCPDGSQHCLAVTCSTLDQPGNDFILWGCAKSQEGYQCAFFEMGVKRVTKSENVSCHCSFGQKQVDLANLQFTLRPVTQRRLKCKVGKEHIRREWGCSDGNSSNSCAKIEAKVGKMVNSKSAVGCECKFGPEGVDFATERTTTASTTPTTTTTAPSTTTTTEYSPPAVDKFGSKLQCLAWEICNLSAKWKQAKVSRRFEIGPKCEEMIKNWGQLKVAEISEEYEKNAVADNNGQTPFKYDSEVAGEVLKGAELGAKFGAAISGGNPLGIVLGVAGGMLVAALKIGINYETCAANLKECGDQYGICVDTGNPDYHDYCCGEVYEWRCYNNYEEIQEVLATRFMEYNATFQAQKAVHRTESKVDSLHTKVDGIREQNEIKRREEENKKVCDPSKECKHCGGVSSCVQIPQSWIQLSGCCEPGYELKCCVRRTTTTTTSTTTTTMTTTTTEENLMCKKATFETHPEGNIYKEDQNKICEKSERHCYVLNCTAVSTSLEGYIGLKAEWGCSETKLSFYENFNKSIGWMGQGHFAGSNCNFFVGKKHDDMSNHNKEVFVMNPGRTFLGKAPWKQRDNLQAT
ncbi:hypothetical protein niasHT_026740 [Heterodera trifolii]|uniref:Uncharacterized protein n=1 Tax=Heterodera trifolii TaxID=157864 RepID=A0ABD2JNK6_9BILA